MASAACTLRPLRSCAETQKPPKINMLFSLVNGQVHDGSSESQEALLVFSSIIRRVSVLIQTSQICNRVQTFLGGLVIQTLRLRKDIRKNQPAASLTECFMAYNYLRLKGHEDALTGGVCAIISCSSRF